MDVEAAFFEYLDVVSPGGVGDVDGETVESFGFGSKTGKEMSSCFTGRGVNVGCQELIFSRYTDTNQTRKSF